MVKQSRRVTRLKRGFLNIGSIFTKGKRADFALMFLVLLLTLFGLIMVFDASVVEANENFGDKFYYLKFQGAYFILGWVGLIIAGNIDYHIYKKIIKWLFLGNLFLLLIVLIPSIGLEIKGAQRWLDLGPLTFQPTETFKTILVLYLATWLEKPRAMGQFFALMVLILGLVILEPDLGTAIVLIATAFVVYYVSGAEVAKFALASFVAFLIGLMLILTSPYRKQRLMTFLNPHQDTLGSSYHVQQIRLSLGSGGLFGLGIGQSKQKYQYLPEATTDSIFAIVGEETGFVGSTLLVTMFMLVIWRCFAVAQKAPDIYGRLIAVGISTWIGAQAFVNLASMVGLAPLTGVPLPFLSYGGTSLVVTLASIGIILNISKQTVKPSK